MLGAFFKHRVSGLDTVPRRRESPGGTTMSASLDSPITWSTAVRIGLGWAGEYALLSLIEDAPEALKVATVVCAVGALAALESREWLQKNQYRFSGIMIAFAMIYCGFILYAIVHVVDIANKQATLRAFYIEGNEIAIRVEPARKNAPELFDENAIKSWRSDSVKWENATAEWIGANIGPTARVRFLDMSALPNLCWSPKQDACDNASRFLNHTEAELRNLSVIMEQIGVYSQ
jgi:hypothetical protein